jgi:hypothetical protein
VHTAHHDDLEGDAVLTPVRTTHAARTIIAVLIAASAILAAYLVRGQQYVSLVGQRPSVLVAPKPVDRTPDPNTEPIGGTLVYLLREDCIGLGRPAGEGDGVIDTRTPSAHDQKATMLIWPNGTTGVREGDRVGVRIPSGQIIWSGDRVDGGGVVRKQADVPHFPSSLAPACTAGGIVALRAVQGLGSTTP